MLGGIGSLIMTIRANWQIRNDPIGFARSIGVKVGDNCRFLDIKSGTFGSEPYLISIGDHVTITHGVLFVTHDGGVWVFREQHPDIDLMAPITVGTNVFIGVYAVILPGVTIGDNCVIGAGAIVNHDIPAGHVAAGVPAKCIKTIDEYWESVKNKAFYIRSLPQGQKRDVLLKHFSADRIRQR